MTILKFFAWKSGPFFLGGGEGCDSWVCRSTCIKYSDSVPYQHTIAKVLGIWHFWFGHQKILKFHVKITKMISTFAVRIKMCAKVIPTKERIYFETSSSVYNRSEKRKLGSCWRVTLRWLEALTKQRPRWVFNAQQLDAPTRSHWQKRKKKKQQQQQQLHMKELKVLKGTQITPLLVLVWLCFRENVTVTCKIVSFCVV